MTALDQAPCDILEWDTDFFGFRVARVRGDVLSQEQVQCIDAWCCQNGVRCLYFLACVDDADTARFAAANEFLLVDIRMTFELQLPSAIKSARSDAIVRPVQIEDVASLQRITQRCYLDTRFYFDPNFDRHLCDSLYETWIKISCEGYAEEVLVAELDGVPVGYISCHLDKDSQTGEIGLVGVSDRVRGRGIGQTLVLSALEWFLAQGIKTVEVVTQGRNCAAQRLYQRCGFMTQAVQLWYHKWYAPSQVQTGSRDLRSRACNLLQHGLFL